MKKLTTLKTIILAITLIASLTTKSQVVFLEHKNLKNTERIIGTYLINFNSLKKDFDINFLSLSYNQIIEDKNSYNLSACYNRISESETEKFENYYGNIEYEKFLGYMLFQIITVKGSAGFKLGLFKKMNLINNSESVNFLWGFNNDLSAELHLTKWVTFRLIGSSNYNFQISKFKYNLFYGAGILILIND